MKTFTPAQSLTSTDRFFSPTLQIIIRGENIPFPFFFKLYEKNPLSGTNWMLCAVTAVNDSNSSPATKNNQVKLQYSFPINKVILIEVWKSTFGLGSFFSSVQFDFLQLFRSPSSFVEFPIQQSESSQDSVIKVWKEESPENKDLLTMTFGIDLYKKSLFPPSLSFSLWKSLDMVNFTKVLQTLPLTVKGNANWAPIQVKVSNQFKQGGTLRVFVHDNSEKIKGHTDFSYADVVELQKKNFALFRFEKKKNSATEVIDQGVLKLLDYKYEKSRTFVEYFAAGLELKVYPVLDFSLLCQNDLSQENKEITMQKFRESFLITINMLQSYSNEKELLIHTVGALQATASDENFIFEGESGELSTERIAEEFKKIENSIQEKSTVKLLPVLEKVLKRVQLNMTLSQLPKYYICPIFLSGKVLDCQNVSEQITLASYGIPISFVIIDLGDEQQISQSPEEIQDQHGYRENLSYVCLGESQNSIDAIKKVLENIPKHIWTLFEKMKILPENYSSREIFEKYINSGNLIHDGSPDRITSSLDSTE